MEQMRVILPAAAAGAGRPECLERPERPRRRGDGAPPAIVDASLHSATNERGAQEGQEGSDKTAEQDRLSHHCETEGRDNSVSHRSFNLLGFVVTVNLFA
jgi:hypothetical protein